MYRFDDLVEKLESGGSDAFSQAYDSPFLVFIPPNTDVQTRSSERLLDALGVRRVGSQSGSPGVGPVAFAIRGAADAALSIGRGMECDVTIPLPRISKLHARVRYEHLLGAWILEDTGSKNGCSVNGRKVETGKREEVPDGATLELGPYAFRFFEAKSFADLVASCSASGETRAERIPVDNERAQTLIEELAVPGTESARFNVSPAVLPLGYQLLRRLGAGGMAEVLLAKRVGPGGFSKQIALKRMLAEFATDKRLVQMFIQEARVAARVNHPNVVQIFELVETNGQWFIAMEFIDGTDLSALIRAARHANQQIPLPIVLRLAAEFCAGMHAAHIATGDEGEPLGIVHRDISPHNILIARSGVAKVADFGVSKAADQMRKTRTGEIKGKLVYMAPEQVDPKLGAVDARTDIYAAGLTLYEMLTYTRPLRRETEVATLAAVVRAEIAPIATLRPDLPAELAEVVMRCLRREPAQRFANAAELQRALERVAVQHTLVASPAAYTDFVAQLPSADEKPPKPKDEDSDTKALTTPVPTPARKPSPPGG